MQPPNAGGSHCWGPGFEMNSSASPLDPNLTSGDALGRRVFVARFWVRQIRAAFYEKEQLMTEERALGPSPPSWHAFEAVSAERHCQ